MPDCFCVRGASAKSSSARPVTVASSTAERTFEACPRLVPRRVEHAQAFSGDQGLIGSD